jgi:hypothetical protein
MNAFLRNIERIRLAEREEQLAETRGVVLEKRHGGGPGRRGAEDAQAKRVKLERVKAAPKVRYHKVMPALRVALKAGALDEARALIASVFPSERGEMRFQVWKENLRWPS